MAPLVWASIFFIRSLRTDSNQQLIAGTAVHRTGSLGTVDTPVAGIGIRYQWQHQAHRVTWAALIATLTMALIVAARVHYGGEVLLPLQSYWLVESGVGPVWLYDMVFLDNDNMTPLPIGFWRTITAMALVGSVLLVTALTLRLTELVPRVIRREAMSDSDFVTLFAVLTLAGYFSLLLPLPMLWDRYLVPMVPFLAMAVVGLRTSLLGSSFEVTRPWRIMTWLSAGFIQSVCHGTRDYLTWNRIRWTALHDLMTADRIPPDRIDGGSSSIDSTCTIPLTRTLTKSLGSVAACMSWPSGQSLVTASRGNIRTSTGSRGKCRRLSCFASNRERAEITKNGSLIFHNTETVEAWQPDTSCSFLRTSTGTSIPRLAWLWS